MVEQSILDAQPIISVSLQYRLGAFGYLYTPEPGNANLAMNDQRNALLWIQKFVEGFGGNRENVTRKFNLYQSSTYSELPPLVEVF
jgi:carboxylesterase type B